MARITVDVVDAGALGAAEGQAWSAFVRSAAELSGPFFALDYAVAAGRKAPGAKVAVVRRRGLIAGFLPFQARGRALQPLGAPLTDYHGLIAPEGAEVSVDDVLAGLNAARFRCTAWVGGPGRGRLQTRRRMVADFSKGHGAWSEGRRAALKDKARRARALARDHGEPTVVLDDPDPSALRWLIDGKRDQYRLTDQHDIFACGWTAELVDALWRQRRPGFGARVSTLRLGERIIAAEASLRAGSVRHLWFPVYDRAFARYSPGALLLLEQLAAAADEGVEQVDFGPDVEAYKAEFADPAGLVREGSLLPAGPPVAAAPSDALDRLRFKAERRFAVIRACEPSWTRAASASLDSLVALSRRELTRAGVSAGSPIPALVEPAVIALPLAAL